MTNFKTVMMKVLKKLIFSIFLASLLLFVLFQKAKSQIVGIDKTSKKELIKNLQNQVNQQKTQLDTIKTTLGTLESKITEQEESMKKIDAEQEFKKQLEENKQKLKNAWIAYLSLEPEVTTDQELTEKFNQAKEATSKHEQEFISKLESKKETIKEIEHKIEALPAKHPTRQEKVQEVEPAIPEFQDAVTQEVPQINTVPTKDKVIPTEEPDIIQTQVPQKPSEENSENIPQPESAQNQQISGTEQDGTEQDEAGQEPETVNTNGTNTKNTKNLKI